MNTYPKNAATLAAWALLSLSAPLHAAVTLDAREDVMTPSFFIGANTVRGYAGDNRPVLRVSTPEPFGSSGAETIYLVFDHDFSLFTGPVTARLTMTSVDGGFGANASAGQPFVVSAHGLTADPLASIIDDTQPDGSMSWQTYFSTHVLAADAAARTAISGFGEVEFDVSALVNDWISGSNAIHALALTGLNDSSGNDFLHGFLNSSEAPGAVRLTISPVPEPSAWALLAAGLGVAGLSARRRGAAR